MINLIATIVKISSISLNAIIKAAEVISTSKIITYVFASTIATYVLISPPIFKKEATEIIAIHKPIIKDIINIKDSTIIKDSTRITDSVRFIDIPNKTKPVIIWDSLQFENVNMFVRKGYIIMNIKNTNVDLVKLKNNMPILIKGKIINDTTIIKSSDGIYK